jgi:hypothetical protein
MLNKPTSEASLLKESSDFAAPLGVAKFICVIVMNVLRKCDLDVQQTRH